MAEAILVLNAGSSSLKFTAYDAGGAAPVPLVSGNLEELYGEARFRARGADGAVIDEHRWDAAPGHGGALDFLFGWLRGRAEGLALAGVGHRVVHGGTAHAAPVRIDAGVLAELETLIPLAPLHQPHNLLPIRELMARDPDLPQVACFDTAFHAEAPAVSQAFALPARITERGVRRYGFHGLSYDHIAASLPEHDPAAAAGRTIVLHLGNGASMCALEGGRSVASTMGFTALDGLPMGTRSGALDPGVLLYLMQEMGMDAVGREIGSLTAALGGLDALVFTAGIGENSAEIRAKVAGRAAWLGVALDPDANAARGPRISTEASRVRVWVIPTDEEGVIARHTARLLAA